MRKTLSQSLDENIIDLGILRYRNLFLPYQHIIREITTNSLLPFARVKRQGHHYRRNTHTEVCLSLIRRKEIRLINNYGKSK